MFIQHIGATGLQNITDGDESYISCVEFTVYGLTGSMIPQCVQMTDGPTTGLLAVAPVYFNCGYVNANTGVSYAAGTAITTDGRYIIDTTGAKFALNVTDAGDGDFYVYGKPLAGPAPSFAASGGSSAVTIADGADVAQGTTTDAAVVNPAAAGTVIAELKGLSTILQAAPTAPAPVAGWIAAGAAASGENPVLMGGADVAGNVQNLPMVTNNDALTATTQKTVMTKSLLAVAELTDIVGVNSVHKANADGVSLGNAIPVGNWVYDPVAGAWDRHQLPNGDNSSPTGITGVCEMLFNGTTAKYDRRRNNNDVIGLASAARTSTTSTPDQISYNFQGLIVGVNVTALTATGTLTVTIEGKDAISSTYYTLFTGTAIATTGYFPYQFYPGAAITSGVSAAGRVPRTFRVTVTHGNGVSITYSVNLSMLA